ncbi:MAG: PAS domain-containing protein, partial [Leptolyngbya sp. SIO1D8]|nr:PAS domain-containing protein [Leptolyngbya sp. SIO1D8]
MQSPPKPFNSLTRQLTHKILGFSLIGLVGLGGAGLLSLVLTWQRIHHRLEHINQATVQDFERFFVAIKSDLLATSASLAATSTRNDVELLLSQMRSRNPALQQVQLLNQTGEIITYAGHLQQRTPVSIPESARLSLQEQVDAIYISPMQLDNEFPYVEIVTVVTDYLGVTQGFLAIQVDLTDLLQKSIGQMVDQPGYLYIVDERNQVLSGDGPDTLEKSTDHDDFASHPNIPHIDSVDRDDFASHSNIIRIYRNLNGYPALASIQSLDMVPWYAIVEKPLFVGVQPLVWPTVIISTLLLAGILAVSNITRFTKERLVKPLRALNRGVYDLRDGKLAQAVQIYYNDELGSLASTFNHVTKQLETSFQDLELRVQERTAQLKLTNQALGREVAKHQETAAALKKSSQDLMEWRDRYEIAARASGQVLFEYDLTTEQDTWGPNTEEIFGYSVDAMPQGIEEYTNRIHPDDRSAFQQILEQEQTAKAPYQIEFRFRNLDGTYRWVEERGITRYDDQGKAIQVIGYIADISDRKQTQERLQELSDRLNLAVEVADIGIWDWDIPSNTLVWDERMYRLYGIQPEEFTHVYDAWLSCLHPDDRTAAQITVQQTLQNQKAYRTEFRVFHADGSLRYIKANALLQCDARGEPQRMLGINYDITDVREREVAMRRQLETIEAAIDGIAILQRGTYVYLNQAHVELFGYEDPSEVVGSSWKLLYPRAEIRRFEQEILPTLTRKRAWQGEAIATRKDGTTFTQGVSLTRTGEGLLICVCRDISDRKQAEQELIQAKEAAEAAALAKSNFLASMSHEIRTPMNGVIGMLNLLQENQLTPYQHLQAKIAQSSAESLLTLLDDILDFSKVDAGKLTLEAIEFDLSQQLGELATSMAIRAQEKGLELILDLRGVKSSKVKGDPVRLRQIFTNLVGNAIKFTEQGEVIIQCCLQADETQRVLIGSVRDTGIGIPAQKFNNLFDPFTQVDASTTRKYGGTGLGLAITQKLCNLMGGQLHIQSELGQGSHFEFTAHLQPSEAEVTAIPELNLQGVSLLVVDDNATHREVLSGQLQNWGAKVVEAADGEQALALCEEQQPQTCLRPYPFDMALIDMQMPGMTGIELGQRFQADERWTAMPLLLMTPLNNQ